MIIDSKGKLFGKISIIDIIVILIICAVALGVGYKFVKTKSVVLGKSDKVVMQFFADEAPEFAVDAVKKGDVCGDYEKGTVFGKVTEIKKDKSKSIGMTAAGEFISSSRPGFSSAIITLEGEGLINIDGGISINNADYFIGRQLVFKAGNAVFMARVYDMKKKE